MSTNLPEVRLSLVVLKETFAVCKLTQGDPIPDWATWGRFTSITRTPDELSILCGQEHIPDGIRYEGDWRCLQVVGPLAFSLVGILHSLLSPLAQAGIGIFAVSTYDTDYLFVKERDLEAAVHSLSQAGHLISRSE